jgi:hypothetical protein
VTTLRERREEHRYDAKPLCSPHDAHDLLASAEE